MWRAEQTQDTKSCFWADTELHVDNCMLSACWSDWRHLIMQARLILILLYHLSTLWADAYAQRWLMHWYKYTVPTQYSMSDSSNSVGVFFNNLDFWQQLWLSVVLEILLLIKLQKDQLFWKSLREVHWIITSDCRRTTKKSHRPTWNCIYYSAQIFREIINFLSKWNIHIYLWAIVKDLCL